MLTPLLTPLSPRRVRVATAVALVAAGAYLVNLVVQVPVFAALRLLHPGPVVAAVLLAPLVYGVCEELVRYAAFGVVPVLRRHRTANGALVAGLAHAGTEAVVLGVLAGGADDLGPFLVGRVFAACAHVAFATLVVLAHRRRRHALLAVAVVAHVLVDATTFALAPLGAWQLVPFAAWAALSVVFVVLVRRRGLLAPEPVASPERVEVTA